ncbi:hypothetical protein E2C01_038548 [Portunus trituberculatus]|uniref:Uncharacterized protein n=1 Tax=Portunus trituberculatus TaxID=210409 RepID=A0A5B7FH41_PORTR|nr:hypothetical protein [Portunus trituberculatus]
MEMNYKYVKNGLFWCILAFYAPNHRNASKTYYLSTELKYVKKWFILVYFSVLCTKPQICRQNIVFV